MLGSQYNSACYCKQYRLVRKCTIACTPLQLHSTSYVLFLGRETHVAGERQVTYVCVKGLETLTMRHVCAEIAKQVTVLNQR